MYYFVSPKIYPLFPNFVGDLLFIVDFKKEVISKLRNADFSGTVTFEISAFSDKKKFFSDKVAVEFDKGETTTQPKIYRMPSRDYGYVEISIIADKSIFHNSYAGGGYAILEKKSGDYLTVNTDAKFSQYRIIEQIKAWGKFSLVHTAIINQSSCSELAKNSFLLVNPYEKTVVVTLSNNREKIVKTKVDALSAVIVDLEPLADGEKVFDVILTSNNRIIAYDVKHLGDIVNVNNIDHLDVYSGISTTVAGFKNNVKNTLKVIQRQFLS